MTVKEFIKWALTNGPLDHDKHYGAQCTDLFRFFHDKIVGKPQPKGVVGAKDFWSHYETDPNLNQNYKKIPNTPDYVPQAGDVIIWRNGKYGHIAIATGEGDTKRFKSLDQNWKGKRQIAIVTHTYSYVYGCLRANVLSTQNSMKTYSQEEWQKERDERNKNWNLYQEEKKTSEKLQTTIQGLKEEIERLKADAVEASAQIELRKKELAKFKEDLAKILYLPAASDAADIEGAVRRLLEVEDQLKDANKKIVQEEKKHALEKDELQKEVNDLKAALAKQEAVLAKQAETNQKLLGRVEDLEKKLNQQQESADITTRWKTFINKLLRLFNEK